MRSASCSQGTRIAIRRFKQSMRAENSSASDQTRVTASLLDKARAQGKSLVTHADDAYICAAPILRDEEILAESLIRVDDLTD